MRLELTGTTSVRKFVLDSNNFRPSFALKITSASCGRCCRPLFAFADERQWELFGAIATLIGAESRRLQRRAAAFSRIPP